MQPGNIPPSTPPKQLAASTTAFYPKTPANELTFNQVFNMSFEDFAKLSPALLSLIPKDALGAVQPGHISALTTDQLAALNIADLSAYALGGLKPEQVEGLSLAALREMSPQVLRNIRTPTLKAMSDQQLQMLSPDAMRDGFPNGRLANLKERISAFTPTQMASISPSDFWLDRSQMGCLKLEVCAALTGPQLSKLTDRQLAVMHNDQLRALKPSSMSGLSPKQFDEFNMFQRTIFTADQRGALKPEIMDKYGFES